MRVNSAYDACISCENFVKFGPVTPELIGLFGNVWWYDTAKTGIFRLISLDILDRFLQTLHHMKALYVQTMDLAYFLICQGTLPWQPNNVVKMLSTPIDTTCIRCITATK